MTTPEKRLEAATAELTARERAILLLRAYSKDEEPDPRISKHMPADQKADCDKLVRAVQKANSHVWERLMFGLEWLNVNDVEMAWLHCASELRARERHLAATMEANGWTLVEDDQNAAHKGKQVALKRMTAPGRGFKRDVPLLWGRLLDDDEPPPDGWDEALEQLAANLKRDVCLRASEFAALEAVLDEMAALLAEPILHAEVLRGIDGFRRKVPDLQEALQPFTGVFDLPSPTAEQIEGARALVEWDAIDPKPPAPPKPNWTARDMLKGAERDALDRFEAEAAASLRSR